MIWSVSAARLLQHKPETVEMEKEYALPQRVLGTECVFYRTCPTRYVTFLVHFSNQDLFLLYFLFIFLHVK